MQKRNKLYIHSKVYRVQPFTANGEATCPWNTHQTKTKEKESKHTAPQQTAVDGTIHELSRFFLRQSMSSSVSNLSSTSTTGIYFVAVPTHVLSPPCLRQAISRAFVTGGVKVSCHKMVAFWRRRQAQPTDRYRRKNTHM